MLSSYHFWQNIQIKAWYFGPTEDKILAFFNRLRQMFPQCRKFLIAQRTVITRAFDTYESKKHPESPRGLIFFVKFIGYILRDLA